MSDGAGLLRDSSERTMMLITVEMAKYTSASRKIWRATGELVDLRLERSFPSVRARITESKNTLEPHEIALKLGRFASVQFDLNSEVIRK